MPRMRLLSRVVFIAAALHLGTARAGAYEDILAGAEHNQIDVVVSLIELGLDPNTATPDGTTLLMTAARNGYLDMVDTLLTRHANHLIQNKFGDTALTLAALGGHPAVVRRLLEMGGPQENRDGWTPLHYAAFGGHLDVAKFLASRGAGIDVRAPNSQTALMLAARAGHLEVVQWLVGMNADLSVLDRKDRTALDIALANKHTAVANYILLYSLEKSSRRRAAPSLPAGKEN
jgi:uncharacterized protein